MLRLEYKPYTLEFNFDARTSRGTMRQHEVVFLKLYDSESPEIVGVGEVAPLPGLSEEKMEDVMDCLLSISQKISSHKVPGDANRCFELADLLIPESYSSVVFGLETALLDLHNGGIKKILDTSFQSGEERIPINGLIWMNDKPSMLRQAEEKIFGGFDCIKMKVGALDFDEELEIISTIRDQYAGILRLDANGAFKNNEVLSKLKRLSEYDIHSIEQPIMPRQQEAMQLVCAKSQIPIALDEELIGISGTAQRQELFDYVKPSYIILKPSLHGGLASCMEWIKIANQQGIGYWITSALESNIGLNAITQLCVHVGAIGFQGLGTGSLYANNINSPLVVQDGHIRYDPQIIWGDIF